MVDKITEAIQQFQLAMKDSRLLEEIGNPLDVLREKFQAQGLTGETLDLSLESAQATLRSSGMTHRGTHSIGKYKGDGGFGKFS